jgi:hypothetical protein
MDHVQRAQRSIDMADTIPNTTLSTDANLFREEAERARRYATAMTDIGKDLSLVHCMLILPVKDNISTKMRPV